VRSAELPTHRTRPIRASAIPSRNVKNGFPFHAITARSTIDAVASEESDHGRQKLERRDEDDEDQADVVNLA